jgi:hypothetical protein
MIEQAVHLEIAAYGTFEARYSSAMPIILKISIVLQFVRSIFGHFVVSRLCSARRHWTPKRLKFSAVSIPTGPPPTMTMGVSCMTAVSASPIRTFDKMWENICIHSSFILEKKSRKRVTPDPERSEGESYRNSEFATRSRSNLETTKCNK